MAVLSTLPSDPRDKRFKLPRSPECPNDITDAPEEERARNPEAGRCGSCAWGFHTMDSPEPGKGEDARTLSLTPLSAGYRSRCGKVELYRDASGRIGALRGGRLFPGKEGNWAYERYRARHPELFAEGS